MRLNFRRLSAFLVVLFIAGLFVQTGASAHDEGPAHHAPMPEKASAVMKAVFTDHHAPQDLDSVVSPIASEPAAACVNGMAAGFPCNNADLESFVSLSDLGGSSTEEANDIWGWTSPNTNKEYALIGMTFGTAFIDISTPSQPIYLGELQTHGAFGSNWRDIKTYADHAFIVSEAQGHGIQVFDLTQLDAASRTTPTTFAETNHYNRIGSAHNIVINEDSGYAYAVGVGGKGSCNGGLHMVDISNPNSIPRGKCFSDDGYTHDAQCVIYSGPDTQHTGKEICIASNEDTITVVDVTNKNNPIMLSRTGYAGSQYTHQGWFTEDQRYFLMNDELDENRTNVNTTTHIIDMLDLDNPVFGTPYVASTAAIDHNLYIKGDFMYQANYTAGLRIIDISDVANANLSEVAFFDVWPADDHNHFAGAWSNYPYFESGVVIMSGIEQGLFVVRPDLGIDPGDSAPTVSVNSPADGATVSGSTTVTANASDDNGVTQVEFKVDGVSIGVDTDGTDGWSASWDTTGTPDGTVAVSATATDTIGQTAMDSVMVNVNNVADPQLHVGDIDGSTASARGGKWDAYVTVTVHDAADAAVSGVTVVASWSEGTAASCVTDGSGVCDLNLINIRRNLGSVTLMVNDITGSGWGYDSGANHDPDGDSNGTAITLLKP